MRITSRFLWINSWITENLKWLAAGSCAAPAEVVEISSPFGNGHHPGATPGTCEEPGDRPLVRVSGPGGRRAASGGQATGQPARRGRTGPLHLIHGGALSDSDRPERLCRHRHGRPATPETRHRCLRARSHPRRRVIVRRAGMSRRPGAVICCWPPAGQRTADRLCVHKHVDHLCKTAPRLCMRGGNAGDPAARPRS